MSKSCKVCKQQVGRKNPGLECSGFCERSYHRACLSLSPERFQALRSEGVTWVCPDCRGAGSPTAASLPAVQASPPIQFAGAEGVDLAAAIVAIRADLRGIRMQQSELMTSVNFCSNKITDFEAQLLEMKKNTSKIDVIMAENRKLRTELDQMNMRLNGLEQMSRINNLEIVGIPERENENLLQIVEKISQVVDSKLDVADIDCVHRVPLNKNGTSQIKNIVVKLHSRRKKEDLMAAFKQSKRNTESNSLKIEGVSEQIFINEHLTIQNKLLFKEAREIAKAKHYKYVWVKHCNIYMRKDDNSRILQIRSHDSLSKLK